FPLTERCWRRPPAARPTSPRARGAQPPAIRLLPPAALRLRPAQVQKRPPRQPARRRRRPPPRPRRATVEASAQAPAQLEHRLHPLPLVRQLPDRPRQPLVLRDRNLAQVRDETRALVAVGVHGIPLPKRGRQR